MIEWRNEAPFNNLLNSVETIANPFPNNDELDGTFQQGWYVNETPDYGPGGPAELLTNLTEGYKNFARHVILSRRIAVNREAFPPTPGLDNDLVDEAYIWFKFWSHQENGPYDFVKIDIREFGSDQAWEPIGFINYTTENVWNDYVMQINDYIGKDIQLRFVFVSDQCETGKGVLFKDFQLARVTSDTQHALFAEFLDAGTVGQLPEQIETLVDDSELNLAFLVGGDVATTSTAIALAVKQASGQLGQSIGIGSSLSGLGVAAFVLTATVVGLNYVYLNSDQPVQSIIFGAPPEALAGDPNLEQWLRNKREVFFDGMSQMTSPMVPDNVSLAYYAAALNGLLEVQEAALNGATNGDPAYVRSFTNAQGKGLKIIIPTEVGSVMNIHNNRIMFQRLFAELALMTEGISVSVYVYDTFNDAYYDLTIDNTDYLSAYHAAIRALNWAHNIWLQLDPRLNPFGFTGTPPVVTPRPLKVDELEKDVIPIFDVAEFPDFDECQGSPIVGSSQVPEPEDEPEDLPLPVSLDTKTQDPCGNFTLFLGRLSEVRRSNDDSSNPSAGCSGGVTPPTKHGSKSNPKNLPPNLNIDPRQGAFNTPDMFGVYFPFQQLRGDVIAWPPVDYYLEGREETLLMNRGYEFEQGAYSSEITEDEMIELGIVPNRKDIPLVDRNPNVPGKQFVFDNIIFEGNELIVHKPGPTTIISCRKTVNTVCLYALDTNASGKFVVEEQVNHVVSQLLHKVEFGGRQSVLAETDEIDNGANMAIFIPGYSEESYLIDRQSITGDRQYEHEDLRYLDKGFLGLDVEELAFFDNWQVDPFGPDRDWETYVYQSPAYLEPGLIGDEDTPQDGINRLFERYFLPGQDNGVEWFDSHKKANRTNVFDDIKDDPSPTVPLYFRDIDYAQEIFTAMARTDGPTLPDEDRVLAIYGENISATRALLMAAEVILSDDINLFGNLRIVLGLLDPVWPITIPLPDQPAAAVTDRYLDRLVFELSQKENVNVFVMHSQIPTLQEEWGPGGPDTWLRGTVEYDMSAISKFQEGNRQFLTKFIHALGHDGQIDMANCRDGALDEATTPLLGLTLDGQTCYSTMLPNERAWAGYMGPSCKEHRNYFRRSGTTKSYKQRAEDFTGASNIFRVLANKNTELFSQLVLNVINGGTRFQDILDSRVSIPDDVTTGGRSQGEPNDGANNQSKKP